MQDPLFLTLAEVVEIHTDQIQRYGGQSSIRDLALLQSALSQPQATFGGIWLHEDLFEMASAYAFHVCQNHPFFDGNKRAALACCLVFLEINGVSLRDPKGMLYESMMGIATSKMSKKEFATFLRRLK